MADVARLEIVATGKDDEVRFSVIFPGHAPGVIWVSPDSARESINQLLPLPDGHFDGIHCDRFRVVEAGS